MDLSDVRAAAQNVIEYIDQHGEDSNLGVISAQCELMKMRLKVVKEDRRPVLRLIKG